MSTYRTPAKGYLSADTRERHMKQFAQLMDQHSTWRQHYREITNFILPDRGRYSSSDVNRGDKRQSYIVDGTPTLVLRTSAAGMMSGMCSQARPWVKLRAHDDDLNKRVSVRRYHEECTRRLLRQFARTNWYKVLPTLFLDLIGFGTGAMVMDEDIQDIARFYVQEPGEYYLGCDGRYDIGMFARKYSGTVFEIVDKFGIDNVSESLGRAYKEGNLLQRAEVLHMVTQNEEYNPRKLAAAFKRFSSCYYEIASSDISGGTSSPPCTLRESGYDRFPVLAPRWQVRGADAYGRSPGMQMLPDCKALMRLQKQKSAANEKTISPPLKAPPSAINNRISVLPSDVNFVDERNSTGFGPLYQIEYDTKGTLEDIREHQARIAAHGYADLFRRIMDDNRDQRATAAEIAATKAEQLVQLGPVLDSVNTDLLAPAVMSMFLLMRKAGRLPPPPPELKGTPLELEFTSLIAEAQKLAGVASSERFVGFITPILATHPEVGDKVDWDGLLETYADGVSLDARAMRTEEQVAQTRNVRNAQQQQAAKAQEAQQLADAAAKIAQARGPQPNAGADLAQTLTGPVAGGLL